MDLTALDALRIALDPAGQAVLAIALVLIMFSVALSLSPRDFRCVTEAPKSYFGGVFAQMIGLPLLTIGLLLLLSPPPSIARGMIVVACCPGGTVSNLLTFLGHGNLAYSVALTATSSLLAAVVTPASILFWSNVYPPTGQLLQTIDISPLNFVIQTMALLGLPLIAGMALAAFAPGLASRLRKHSVRAGTLMLLGVIIYGCYLFMPVLLPALPYLLAVVVVHNGLAFGLGVVSGLVLRTDPPTRRALLFEIGIQNSGLAIVILIAQLEGLGGAAAIATTWGLWHLVGGGFIVWGLRIKDRRGTH